MKSFTLYNSLSPMLRNSGFGADPFEMLDRILEGETFLKTGFRNPAADVREGEKSYLIDVELPGLSEKDLKLELKDGILSLSTAKSEESEESEEKGLGKFLRRERREFAFARSFLLPEDADGERIEAKLKDGLLSVEIPKKPETAAKVVPVKAA